MEQKIVEKVNSAVFRADLTNYAKRIQDEGLEVIVQRNNKDLFRAVPLDREAKRNGTKQK